LREIHPDWFSRQITSFHHENGIIGGSVGESGIDDSRFSAWMTLDPGRQACSIAGEPGLKSCLYDFETVDVVYP
jgi:hypothetical protein